MLKQIISRARIVLATAVLLVLTATVAGAQGNASANLDQCRNGKLGDPPAQCKGPGSGNDGWVNGAAGASNAHWKEGESIAYRMRYDNLTIGTHVVTIEWDTTKGGHHAIDFITSFDRTENTALPCDTVAGCTPPPTSQFPIPNDPNVQVAFIAALPAGERLFSCYGCTITGMTLPVISVGTYAGDSSTQTTITFTANVANPVMAWGGHIATQTDWGFGSSASAISGDPYHMRLIALDGKGGNQDRALAAAAVVGMGGTTTRSGTLANNNFNPGTPISDTMYLTGTNSSTPIAGTVQFSYCATTLDDPNWPDCNAGSTNFGSPVNVVAGTNGGFQTGTANSINVSFGVGKYCFKAVFTPAAAGSPYPGVAHTNQVSTGWGAECFILSGATAVTVSSFEASNTPAAVANDGMLAGLSLAGILALGGVALVAWRRR